jgi:hypothetical protein
VSGTTQPSFERSDILKPMLDHAENNDAIVLHGLQQKVLGEVVARGREIDSSAQHLVFQALRDALTGRAEEILSQIRKVFDGIYIEDFDNLSAGLKAELLSRLELFRDLASLELQRSTQQIRSGIDAQFLPSQTAIHEHLNQLQPKLFAEIDLICTKLHDAQQPRVLFKKGEVFAGNRAARALFTKARQSLDIIDAYFGPQIFDMLEVSDSSVQIRLISDKQPAPVVQAFHAFNQQFNNRVEFRICAAKDLHDRYVIIDKRQAFHIGHSIKDLGTKDSEIASVPPAEIMKRFEQLWATATPVI